MVSNESDEDISLSLNFSSGKSFKQRKSNVTKPQRIAERRNERRASYEALTSAPPPPLRRENERSSKQPPKHSTKAGDIPKKVDVTSEAANNVTPTPQKTARSLERPLKGTKRPASAGAQQDDKKRQKFSMIFTSNPEVPKTDSVAVNPVKEVVFSADSFSAQKLHPFMVSNLEKLGVNLMTSIQQISLPYILDGRDVLIKSQTGSGKTYAYVVPIVEKLRSIEPHINRSDGPYCIVVVPTRELALQSLQTITNVLRPFLWIVPGCIMGGERRKSEKARLRRGINILVSTTGRLLDHIEYTTSLDLSRVQYLVIDEADRLSEMGFEKDITRIVDTLKEKCSSPFQTVLLSATLSAGVEKLAGMSLNNPARLEVNNAQVSQSSELDSVAISLTSTKSDGTKRGKTGSKSSVNVVSTSERKSESGVAKLGPKNDTPFALPDSLTHHFVVVPSKLRLTTLATFLLSKCRTQGSNACKSIVFMSTQNSVEFHHRLLNACLNGSSCSAADETKKGSSDAGSKEEQKIIQLFKLHGGMQQKDRTSEFNKFSSAAAGVLISTDVAARGLDLPGVDWIVQYNTPGQPRDYIHRVGRTARIGCNGNALLFLTPAEVKYTELLNQIEISATEMKYASILSTLRGLRLDLFTTKNNEARTVEQRANRLQAVFETRVSESTDMQTLARDAFQSFIRGYATFSSDLKHIFHVSNLHLGHVATSFALTETPGHIAQRVARSLGNTVARDRKRSRAGNEERVQQGRHIRNNGMSEFSDGLTEAVTGPTTGPQRK